MNEITYERERVSPVARVVGIVAVMVAAAGLTAVFFMVLPLMQAITAPRETVLLVRDAPGLEPPPPADEPEPEEEQEEEPEPEPEEAPELEEEPQTMDLSMIEQMLTGGLGGSGFGPDTSIKLSSRFSQDDVMDDLVGASELDQPPRAIFQPGPSLPTRALGTSGRVAIIFIVDENGRVQNPIVKESTDPLLDGPALKAVSKWKFEPGRRKGEPVAFRMRVPLSFK